MRGRTHSPEVRAKISAALSGTVRPAGSYRHGQDHHNFKTGEYAGTARGKYVKDHLFIRRHFGHERVSATCEACGAPNREVPTKAGWTKSSLQFSYLGAPGESSRDRGDYALLCSGCHAAADRERRAR